MGCGWQGVCLSTPHIRHTGTQTQHRVATSFIWPRHAQSRARRGGSLWLTWGAPHRKQIPLARTFREAWWKAFSKDSEMVKQPGRPTTRPTKLCLNSKVLMTSSQFSGRWPRKQASWMLRYRRCRRLGPAVRGLELPIVMQKPPKGIYSFSTW